MTDTTPPLSAPTAFQPADDSGYHRVLLKLSGETFGGGRVGVDADIVLYLKTPPDEATLRQMFSDMKYPVQVINEGLALVYSELEDTNYTGIGISCGGGLCNVCLAYLSVPVLSFSIAKAGDFIDASAAAVTGERANRILGEAEAGGGAQLQGLPDRLSEELHLRVWVAEDPMTCVVRGATLVLENLEQYEHLMVPLDRSGIR